MGDGPETFRKIIQNTSIDKKLQDFNEKEIIEVDGKKIFIFLFLRNSPRVHLFNMFFAFLAI
jgi:hypothetical protein